MAADYLPTVAYDHAGRALTVWVRDADADLSDISDRRLVYSSWDGLLWSAPAQLAALPAGASMPSLAFDEANQPIVACVVADDLQATLGNRQFLWYAYWNDGTWESGPIGTEVRAEKPEIFVHEGRAHVIVRRLGEPDSPHFDGEVATTSADLSRAPLQWSPVGLLTEE